MNNVISLHLTDELIDTQLVSSRDDKSNRVYVELVCDADYSAYIGYEDNQYFLPEDELIYAFELDNALWSGEGTFTFYVGSTEHDEVKYHIVKVENSMYNVQIQTVNDTHFKLVANTDTATRLNDFYSTTKEVEFKIDHANAEVISTVNAEIDRVSKQLQEQIDGNIQTYTGSYVPTLQNEPASEWTTEQLKDQHLGDIYIVNADGGDQAGYAYRFDKSQYDQTSVVYSWMLIKDNDISKAIADSAAALIKANETGERLDTDYYTKQETNTQISQTAESIEQTAAANYATKQSVTDLNTNITTNYSTTEQMNSVISQSASGILQTVSNTYATQTSVNDLTGAVNNISERTESNESAIEQNATAIEARVKTTDYNGNEIISKINLSSTNAVISADRISLEGKIIDLTGDNVVISSTNYSVTKDGAVTARNISITGGSIVLTANQKVAKIIVKLSDETMFSKVMPGRIGVYGASDKAAVIYCQHPYVNDSTVNGTFMTPEMVGVGTLNNSLSGDGDMISASHYIDADGFDGYPLSSSATGNTIAVRNINAYLHASWFNSTHMIAQNMLSFTVTGLVFRSSDGFLRSATKASARSYLGPTILTFDRSSKGTGGWILFQIPFNTTFNSPPLVSIMHTTLFSNENVVLSGVSTTSVDVYVYAPTSSFTYGIRVQVIGYVG